MPPVDKDLTAPAWMEKAPLSPNSLYPAELNPSPGAPMMFGPNITGTFGAAIGGNVETDSTGPFWSKSIVGGRSGWSGDGGTIYGFDVSRSDGTYGKASTVQPASLRFLPCIKA